jgi:hypothetical protein
LLFPYSLCLAICICVEQTFSEASADEASFGPAFSVALDTYLSSSLQKDVNKEIAGLPEGYKGDESPEKLVEIIKAHPLRMLGLFEFQDFHAQNGIGFQSQP